MKTVFQNGSPTFDVEDNPFNQNETNMQEKKFITSPTDIEIHCKGDLRRCHN